MTDIEKIIYGDYEITTFTGKDFTIWYKDKKVVYTNGLLEAFKIIDHLYESTIIFREHSEKDNDIS